MIKKIISVLLFTTILITALFNTWGMAYTIHVPDMSGDGATDADYIGRTFIDVPKDAWYSTYVDYCYGLGYISGIDVGYFSPGGQLSRAMAVQLLFSVSDETAEEHASTFLDVKVEDWFYPSVSWAEAKGVSSGIGESCFGPAVDITRQDFVVMLYNYHRLFNGQEVSTPQSSLEGFGDSADVAEYALYGMEWAINNGIVSGYLDHTLRPMNKITRSEAVSVLTGYDKQFGHDWRLFEVFADRTCGEDGISSYRCAECGAQRGVIYKSGHKWFRSKDEVPATCTEAGYFIYKCNGCDRSQQMVLEPKGHRWYWAAAEDLAPTCTVDGYSMYRCHDCDAIRKDAVPAIGHNWQAESVIAPTYTVGGYTLYRCANCQGELHNDFTDPLKPSFTRMNTLQIGTKWSYEWYGGGTLIMTGCGIFATVNAIYNLNGSYFTPTQVATWAHANGHFNASGNGEGTYDSLFPAFARAFGPQYGFKYVWGGSGSAYDKRLREHIQSGGTAIVHVPIHFMAVIDYDPNTGRFLVYDSAPGSGVSTPSRTRRGLTTPYGDWFTPAQMSSGALRVDRYHLFSMT